jgi:uncharacterized membrane protein YfcA
VNLTNDNVDSRVFRAVTPAAVVAVLVGAYIASLVSGEALQRIFGIAIVLVALRMLYATWRYRRVEVPD